MGPDFLLVRLTAFGQQLAGDGSLRVSNGRRSFEFTGDTPQKVERSYEWRAWLSKHLHSDGQALFEEAPAVTTNSAAPEELA